MIKINEAIIVEGKYDKIKLCSIVDAVIIVTGGFGIFKDEEKLGLIRYYAEKTGIIILTDSDSAGRRIRGYIKGAIKSGSVKNVYIPDIFGKEKRKTEPSKEGKLGVEGVPEEVIITALRNAGVFCEETDEQKEPITNQDLYALGFSGKKDSASKRAKLLAAYNLPSRLGVNSLIKVLNCITNRDDFIAEAAKIPEE